LSRPFRLALIIALCAHASGAVAFAFARVRPRAATPAVIAAAPAEDEHEVSLLEPPADRELEPRAVERASAFDAPTPRKSRVHVASAAHPSAVAAVAAVAAAGSAEGAPASAVAMASVMLTREAAPASVLDLPAARDYGPTPATSASGAGGGTTAIDSVRAALDDHDRALGLGTDSALVAAIRHAALGSRVPLKSSAVLWATAGADGSVVDAEATNASSDPEAWNEVAAAVVRSMKGARVRAVLGARGARLSFKVESLVRQGAGNAVAPSMRVGTPLYRCMEACTASGNIDPSDALLDMTSRPQRVIEVRALSAVRVD
jgi:hypothetical protein